VRNRRPKKHGTGRPSGIGSLPQLVRRQLGVDGFEVEDVSHLEL
jgi:hypothetical protein